jgi:hypothetical protein
MGQLQRLIVAMLSVGLLTAALTACATTESTATSMPPPSGVEDGEAAAATADADEAEVVQDQDASSEADEAIPSEDTVEMAEIASVDDDGNTVIESEALDSALDQLAITGLTDDESEGLIFMREEEKLAHDVYVYLHDLWDLPLFENIAGSETTHTDAVAVLLTRYGLDDPVTDSEAGVFANPILQTLYDELTVRGAQSLSEALLVGALVEEIDIRDLQELMDQTDNADILLVYDSLTMGSRNHLRAFTSTLLRQTGETYEPEVLDPSEYEEIVGGDFERGSRRGRGSTP